MRGFCCVLLVCIAGCGGDSAPEARTTSTPENDPQTSAPRTRQPGTRSGPTAGAVGSQAASTNNGSTGTPLLEDDFSNDATRSRWQRLSQTSQGTADHWASWDISRTRNGWLNVTPRASVWYRDYRGELLFQSVTGDFFVTTKLRVTNRRGNDAPAAQYSLAGLMLRSPANTNGENYTLLSLGTAGQGGRYNYETKNTRNNQSDPKWTATTNSEAELGVLRIGESIVMLTRTADEAWNVIARYHRPDFPQKLQVGLTAYGDWTAAKSVDAATHNRTGVSNGEPDLLAQFDHFQITRTTTPQEWQGRQLANREQVPDEQILFFLSGVGSDGSSLPNTPVVSTPPTNPPSNTPAPATSSTNDDLAAISDEFDNTNTLSKWLRIYQVEQSKADQLESLDIGRTREGWMVMRPYTSSWYQDYRGVLVHKRITGDFVVTTNVRVARRTTDGAPQSQFSLAGIMVRTPRNVTPQTWRPGQENYIFLSLGAADRPGRYQFEVKTTINSDSKLAISDANTPMAMIQVARIGEHFILLKKTPDGNWNVHQRYHRRDMPRELQVGFTCYTDWPGVERLTPQQQNTTVIRQGNPDLTAGFEFFRARRLQVPTSLQGKNLSDPQSVPDAELLRFLGAGPAR